VTAFKSGKLFPVLAAKTLQK